MCVPANIVDYRLYQFLVEITNAYGETLNLYLFPW